jgi:2,3-bisphosphoglycerate-dependent phosphoglycerate mutase
MLAVAAGSEQIRRAMKSLEAAFLIGVEGVTEIWLVRHADCYEDMVEVEDPPLSELGRRQSQRLAERLTRAGPDAVYSSPYRRAMETAHAITEDVRVDPRLVEMPLEISEDGTLDFQETPDSAVSRMRGVLDDIVRDHQGQRVVVVSHGASIIACLTDAMQLEAGRLRLLPYYTSISMVRVLGDRRMVGTFGDVAHLE